MNPFIDEILHEYRSNLGELRTQSENLDDNARCRLPIHWARVEYQLTLHTVHVQLYTMKLCCK